MAEETSDPGDEPRTVGARTGSGRSSEPLRLEDLYLVSVGPDGRIAVQLDRIVLAFDRDGVRVERSGEGVPRVLPWTSLTTHVVEPWRGGITPEWWVDPELNRAAPAGAAGPTVVDPDATNRPLPDPENGSLISLQTPFATYRFLAPGTDPVGLADTLASLALSHQGPSGLPAVTRVVERPVPRTARRDDRITWQQVQPVLVVVLVVFLACAATLILLQSAGSIHLPFLGGANPGAIIGPVRR